MPLTRHSQIRSWRNTSRKEGAHLAAGLIAPGQLSCAQRLPTSLSTSFWTASWVKQHNDERKEDTIRAANRADAEREQAKQRRTKKEY